MEHKKITTLMLSLLGVVIIVMFLGLSGKISYPLNVYIMILAGCLLLGVVIKLIYNLFNPENVMPPISYSTSEKRIFFISSYRSTVLSITMIILSAFILYLFIQLLPSIAEEISKERSVAVIAYTSLFCILSFLSIYGLIMGIKLFIRRNKIIQLIINEDSLEFLPIYDYGSATRNFSAVSMFFRKNLRKVYFTDQLYVEMVNNKWNGNKIKVYVEGIGFYLPFLYNDLNELDEVFHTIKEKLKKYNNT